jgi:hypothetical protein
LSRPGTGSCSSVAGHLAVLDLGRGRIASRRPVGAQPDQIAVDGTTLWIAHAGNSTLARVDVSSPAAPRMLASVRTSSAAVALSADPELKSVFVSVRRSALIARHVDGGARPWRAYLVRISAASLAAIAVAAPHLLIVAEVPAEPGAGCRRARRHRAPRRKEVMRVCAFPGERFTMVERRRSGRLLPVCCPGDGSVMCYK